ncbi:uncharacterized protein J4E78_010725 [Alternaria triticimaculans]|uniref:uncharacterized protein n=1 Tax=Alternaria triticimaculans TaxID=297637 RepID=UPI0020C28EE7|nr:uncharacterized protein J4E78_010725 [Alternaria triticimaculans]KAI4640140.1 hypothetical protein J4E78_010725 [Alternaria triticimaculans]
MTAEKGFGRKDNRETAQKTSGKRVRGQYTKSRYDGRQDQATLGTAQEEEKGSDWGLSSIWGGGKKKKKSSKSVKLDSPRRGTTFNPSVKRPREYSDSVPKSPGATILQRGRLKRDYAAFDTNEGPQQGGGVQSDMRYNHRPESNQPGEMFMSPEMQNSLLPSVSTEEKQAQQAHQQTQNQGQTRRSPALVHLARPHSQAYDAQDQASQRAINIASGAGQESTGSHITSSDTAPIFKFDPILAPPEMPPRLYPQNMYIPGGEPMMRPPSSRAYPPTPEEAMRKFKRQQTTPAFVSPESARIQPIDELHDRSPGIMDERTACSGYRSFRGGLKYTISEDRTTDAFKRRKVHFIALGHSNSRAAEVEEVDKSDAARASVLADSNPSDDTGTMYTDNLEDLFNMDEYENPEQSTFDDAFFNFE